MSFSEASNRELNDQLQVLVAEGDEDARTRMIESNMRLAVYKVEHFIAQWPQYGHLKDDLLSEAFIGLTEGVDYIRDNGAGSNPTGLLAQCIDQQLRTATTQKKEISTTRQGDLSYEPDTTLELMEEIEACCENDLDRAIVRQRAQGYSDAEIGESIGKPRLFVTRARQRLAQTFEKR